MILRLFLITLIVSMTGCISAGDTVIKCYSRLYVNDKVMIKRLNYFWERYPENRLDSSIISKIQLIHHKMFSEFIFIDTSFNGHNQQYVFQKTTVNKDYKRDEWYIKSTDNRMIFIVDIANKGEWINGFNCDLCLVRVLFMNKINLNFRNWELSSEEKKDAKATFEKDVLDKLKM
ncbi:hypothetical protein [uncultured Acetobacteroides sp.]|uniref:hypothetical protein n=1 Tax=uncultured Acetobacteroides sp. TaxID=1760811 RepID=UPI0029F5743C|nr:hypothetical protein [uncultured Acetobacteroides sp.]